MATRASNAVQNAARDGTPRVVDHHGGVLLFGTRRSRSVVICKRSSTLALHVAPRRHLRVIRAQRRANSRDSARLSRRHFRIAAGGASFMAMNGHSRATLVSALVGACAVVMVATTASAQVPVNPATI